MNFSIMYNVMRLNTFDLNRPLGLNFLTMGLYGNLASQVSLQIFNNCPAECDVILSRQSTLLFSPLITKQSFVVKTFICFETEPRYSHTSPTLLMLPTQQSFRNGEISPCLSIHIFPDWSFCVGTRGT